MQSTLVSVIYDGISQAIFESQVLLPLIKRRAHENHDKICIVSFEALLSPSLDNLVATYKAHYPFIEIILFKRTRFITSTFLWFQALQLRPVLNSFPSYTLIARGPFAGLIARRAFTKRCTRFILQARGLVAQEYAYTHQHKTGFSLVLHKTRLQQFHRLEKEAYTPPKNNVPFSIETVSPALQHYLQSTYQIPKNCFIAAAFDTPPSLSYKEKLTYRAAMRTKLAISFDAPVYVYNGSLKPWQCPQETIALFKERWKLDQRSIFLALTPDTGTMEAYLKMLSIPLSAYRVVQVPHTQVLATLCAADYGFLLREPHLMNWVSRPTKLLEYEAVGLQVIHNNTIELLLPKGETDTRDL